MKTVVRNFSIWGYLVYSVLIGTFIVGETFDAPGGWPAVWMSLIWVIPLVILLTVAYTNPRFARPLFILLAFAIAISGLTQIIWAEEWREWKFAKGPVLGVATLVLCVSLAVWARHKSSIAGFLMLISAAIPLLAESVAMGALRLGGSSAALSLPAVFVGILLMIADQVDKPVNSHSQ